MISADVPQSAQAYKSSRNSAAAFLLRYRFASVFSATFHHIFIHPEDLNLTILFFEFSESAQVEDYFRTKLSH